MSKIEVNAIEPQCGTTLTVGAVGTTVTVPSNVVKSNALQASDAGNIISQSGTTITLGATGDSINLASGATQSGFGRTGTVDWITTPKTTGTFTAVSGEGYFLNTSGGVITANLPAGVAGAIVSFADYAATWQTSNVTVVPNGTDKIGSQNENATLNVQGQSVTFVFVDSTQGWINTMDSTSNVRGVNPFIVATGGTITCSGDFKIHTFTGPGTFTVTNAGAPVGSNTVDYMVVAGGAGGANAGDSYGGGGAGGFRESPGTASGSYTVSPLGASPAVALPVSVQPYTITVGAGGAVNTNGGVSTFSTITSAGGGTGGTGSPGPGYSGGSGGGGGSQGCTGYPGGTGNTPPVSPPQGNTGGTGRGNNSPLGGIRFGGGGGGAGAVGGSSGPNTQGPGGAGVSTSISGSPLSYAGGAGAGKHASGCDATPFPNGSTCGTGASGASPGTPTPARNGTTNRGGGGGGSGSGGGCGGSGGSGIVIIRYKFQ